MSGSRGQSRLQACNGPLLGAASGAAIMAWRGVLSVYRLAHTLHQALGHDIIGATGQVPLNEAHSDDVSSWLRTGQAYSDVRGMV